MNIENMQNVDASNSLFSLASDLVNHTSRHIFITGKAGTGKTTFLKYIKQNCPKQTAVVAPTGVAAINAGGVTIHSFFQLPLSPFIPQNKSFFRDDEAVNRHSLLSRLRLNTERRKILQALELLIIDEVSMVRCDILDAIDLILRHIRYRHSEPFGGVQVLFIGDMFQLPPVVKEQEWSLLRDYYQGPYFFDSQVLKENPPVYIEFTKIYRQSEEKFIQLLNKVRNNQMDEDGMRQLQDRYHPDFVADTSEGYVLLTTHNEKARTVNAEQLSKLPGKMFSYKAEIDNEFPPTAFPADEFLHLKVGAQVMFIKNDKEKERRYFNGKIGIVKELNEETILIQCNNEASTIEMRREKWENIRYTLDRSSRQLNEDVLGSFSQYPLRLAWAITIHKSQGLTFEKAVIDAGSAFSPGQVYVALSRCTTLGGLILHSKIRSNSLFSDNRVVQFSMNSLPVDVLSQELSFEKKRYQQKTVSSLFEFNYLQRNIKRLQEFLLLHTTSFNAEAQTWCRDILSKIEVLRGTSEKFLVQLTKLFGLTERAEENIELQERLKSASAWFCSEIKSITEILLQCPAVTDSTIHAKEFNESLREVCIQLAQQNFLLQGFAGKFNMENFHRRKRSFIHPTFAINAYAGVTDKRVELSHPNLYYQLKKLRDHICSKRNLPIYFVASGAALEEMSTFLPQTLKELEQISGFGKLKVESYGSEFLSIIVEYAGQNNLSSKMVEKQPKRNRAQKGKARIDTKLETLKLYKQGKSVSEISTERKLAIQTIEGHLAFYIKSGEINIVDLVAREKIVLIEPYLKNYSGEPLASIKDQLGSQATWGEIRMVLASKDSKSSTHINH